MLSLLHLQHGERVEWLVSMPAVQVVIGSALTIIGLVLLIEIAPLMYFVKKFQV